MKFLKTILVMGLFIFVILFSIQNKDEVILKFGLYPIGNQYWELPKIPIFLIILCSILLGIFIGGISDFYKRLRLRRTLRQKERVIERLEKELGTLKGTTTPQPDFLKEKD